MAGRARAWASGISGMPSSVGGIRVASARLLVQHSTITYSLSTIYLVVLTIMHSTALLLTIITAISPVFAAPADNVALQKRADFDAPDGGDVTILNYALTLEYLERKFYYEGIRNYSQKAFSKAGFKNGFYGDLLQIFSDEQVKHTYPFPTNQLPIPSVAFDSDHLADMNNPWQTNRTTSPSSPAPSATRQSWSQPSLSQQRPLTSS